MIYDVLPVNNYLGNGSSTNFDFNFFIEDGTQLKVYHYNNNSLKTELVENVDYSVNEYKNENGSYITFPLDGSAYSILQPDEKISLELTLPILQDTQYNNSSLLNLKSLEYSLDYLTRLIQIYARKVELCVKVEEGSDNTPEELIETINNQSLSAINASNSANSALASVQSIKEQVEQIQENIDENGDKFDKIDEHDVSIGEINSTLSNKASTDFSNITTLAKSVISELSVPDYINGVQGVTGFDIWKTVDKDVLVSACIRNNSTRTGISIYLKDASGNIVPSAYDSIKDNLGLVNTTTIYTGSAGLGLTPFCNVVVPKGYSYELVSDLALFVGCVEYPLKGVSE